jgi:hypothetical protein
MFTSTVRPLKQNSIPSGPSGTNAVRAMAINDLTRSSIAKQQNDEEAAWLFLEELRWKMPIIPRPRVAHVRHARARCRIVPS